MLRDVLSYYTYLNLGLDFNQQIFSRLFIVSSFFPFDPMPREALLGNNRIKSLGSIQGS